MYEPTDQMYLWYLANPEQPILVGELGQVRQLRGVSLRHDVNWRNNGFSLSEDLPHQSLNEFLPSEKDSAAGAVDDARPDRWGEQVIRVLNKPPRLSLMEYLYFAGDERFGALGVSLSKNQYQPCQNSPLPQLSEIDDLEAIVERVLNHEPIPQQQRRLLSPGVSMGGARPKALLMINGEPWVVKFSAGEPINVPLVEHATMTLAGKSGIRVAETKAIRTTLGHAIAIKRFDRASGKRIHCLSAHVALRAAGEIYGYPELAQLFRRKGSLADQQELFRRMVFNILMDNTDDHEKNHVIQVTESGEYRLAPAFDVLPSGQALGYQQMRVGIHQSDSTIENSLSMIQHFGLKPQEATNIVKEISLIISEWKKHFSDCGVSSNDIEDLAEQIDRPFLKDQRKLHPTRFM